LIFVTLENDLVEAALGSDLVHPASEVSVLHDEETIQENEDSLLSGNVISTDDLYGVQMED
jgi:hypothetical protein